MENTEFKKLLKFHGDHGKLVGLRIMNNILTAITLGFYYPWARVAYLKYMYGETEYIDSRFTFHGTGREIFIGFLKAVALFVGLYILLIVCVMSQSIGLMILGMLLFYVAIILLIPVAIHGSCKYRLSRTSWRGIHFGYRGNLKEFMKLYLVEFLLTAVTFGIYASWMQVKINKYIRGNTRFGNVEFRFDGTGGDLFVIKLKGVLLSIVTLGIYMFWYYRNMIAFHINNTKIIQNGKEISLHSTMSPSDIFLLMLTNYLIVVFTLGIGTGIAINRIMRVAMENVEFSDAIDASLLAQTEEEYKNAAGDDIAGMLDISII